MIVLLEYSGTFVPENPVSLPLSEMTYKTHCLAISWRVVGRKEDKGFPQLEVGEIGRSSKEAKARAMDRWGQSPTYTASHDI